LLAVVVLVPLGLLTQNPAWGEWEEGYYEKLLGYVPKGIAEAPSISAPLPDYSSSFLGETGSYYLSAVVGIGVIFGLFFLLKRVLKREG